MKTIDLELLASQWGAVGRAEAEKRRRGETEEADLLAGVWNFIGATIDELDLKRQVEWSRSQQTREE
jgi:hypothetical protein